MIEAFCRYLNNKVTELAQPYKILLSWPNIFYSNIFKLLYVKRNDTFCGGYYSFAVDIHIQHEIFICLIL